MKIGARYEAASPLPLYPELLIDISGQQSKTLERGVSQSLPKTGTGYTKSG